MTKASPARCQRRVERPGRPRGRPRARPFPQQACFSPSVTGGTDSHCRPTAVWPIGMLPPGAGARSVLKFASSVLPSLARSPGLARLSTALSRIVSKRTRQASTSFIVSPEGTSPARQRSDLLRTSDAMRQWSCWSCDSARRSRIADASLPSTVFVEETAVPAAETMIAATPIVPDFQLSPLIRDRQETRNVAQAPRVTIAI